MAPQMRTRYNISKAYKHDEDDLDNLFSNASFILQLGGGFTTWMAMKNKGHNDKNIPNFQKIECIRTF